MYDSQGYTHYSSATDRDGPVIELQQYSHPADFRSRSKPLPIPPRTFNKNSYTRVNLNPVYDDGYTPLEETEEKDVSKTSFWLPFTLRPPFLIIIFSSAVALLLAIVALHVKSQRNHGLGNDGDGSMFVFGWKFVPTLVAVVYTLLHSMLLDGVTRSHPFARLNQHNGAYGKSSLLRRPGAWWSTLRDGFKRKKYNHTFDWLLICTSWSVILAIFVISPLSAAFLIATDIDISSTTNFDQIQLGQRTAGDLAEQGVPRFRTVSNLLRNVNTSAWITNDFAALPAWPSSIGEAPIGSILTGSSEIWRIESAVLKANTSCEPLRFIGTKLVNVSEPFDNITLTSTVAQTSLAGDGGCTIDIKMPTYADFVGEGGVIWVDLQNIDPDWSAMSFDSHDTNYGYTVSSECPRKELVLLGSSLMDDQINNVLTSNPQISAQLCSTDYHFASIPIEVVNSNSQSYIHFQQGDFLHQMQSISSDVFATDQFNGAFFASQWSGYFAVVRGVACGGPACLLAGMNDFTNTTIIQSNSINSQLSAIKQRYLGEVFLSQISRPGQSSTKNIRGIIEITTRRIAVAPATAITLEVVMFIELVLILIIVWMTRPTRRVLGVSSNPGYSATIADLLADSDKLRNVFKGIDNTDSKSGKAELKRARFRLSGKRILVESTTELTEKNSPAESSTASIAKTKTWRSTVIKRWVFACLGLVLTAMLVVIIVLWKISRSEGLFEKAFVYNADIVINKVRITTLAPYSIIPTLLSVSVAAWWGAMETEFRQLQPYLAMLNVASAYKDGVHLSYQSSYLALAVVRAIIRKHWLLALVTYGAISSQVLTIAMSALWEREYQPLVQNIVLQRSLDFRSQPVVTSSQVTGSRNDAQLVLRDVLSPIYAGLRTNWLQTAALEFNLNGSQPSWSQDGWSFVPINLTSLTSSGQETASSANQTENGVQLDPSTRLTVNLTTSALRAQIDCSPYPAFDNQSNWMTFVDFSNTTEWNLTTTHDHVTAGYVLGDATFGNVMYTSDGSGNITHTGILGDGRIPVCCENYTTGSRGDAVLAQWTFNVNENATSTDTGKFNFTVKWIYGSPMWARRDGSNYGFGDTNKYQFLIWPEAPQMTALNCMPRFEKANASVLVDPFTNRIHNYEILTNPQEDQDAWSSDFVPYSPPGSFGGNRTISTSYAYLYIYSLLRAAGANEIGHNELDAAPWDDIEDPSDVQFSFKDSGMNLDYMSYSMLSQAKQDKSALTNLDTLSTYANRTFSTFFQHFVNYNVSLETGGWAYQQLGLKEAVALGESGPVADMDRTLQAVKFTRVQMLRMSPAATWLCVTMLASMLAIILLVLVTDRYHLSKLVHGVESIADVGLLFAASDAFLNHVRKYGSEPGPETTNIKTKLGWFRDRDGRPRWGIELYGPEHNVVWLDDDGNNDAYYSQGYMGVGGRIAG